MTSESGQANHAEPLAGRRVLLVDDNEDASDTLALLLRQAGHNVRVLSDGREAVDTAMQFRPQVVLLDVGLPGVSGFDVARALRQVPELRDTVLVAVSGYGHGDYVRRAREAGFSHYYVKPLAIEALRALLDSPPPPNL
ncbi:MAG TPA: response regulator [Gemmatimonadaceae bacterium]